MAPFRDHKRDQITLRPRQIRLPEPITRRQLEQDARVQFAVAVRHIFNRTSIERAANIHLQEHVFSNRNFRVEPRLWVAEETELGVELVQ